MEYETVIGLEVHAQLKTKTKIFCSCPTSFGSDANSNVCPVCLGYPGTLPVLNRDVVNKAILLGLATNCRIAPTSVFARKNYFYPDLPKGYQISQFELPLCEHGALEITVNGQRKKIGITRIHLEEDAGKSIHGENLDNPDYSYVDLNRTGTPLAEIVSEPEISSSEEAKEYLNNLKLILEYLDICDCNLEEGSMRCDANISVRPRGQKELGTKAELKNMNSFNNLKKAVDYEVSRQIRLLESGGRVIQETRLWDAAEGKSRPMRSKEEANDYRYFPEPDLPPLHVSDEWVEKMRVQLPELPQQKRDRFVSQYAIPEYDAAVLSATVPLADYFEEVMKNFPDGKAASNWIMTELLGALKKDNHDISTSPVSALHIAQLLQLVKEGTISGKIAKTVFEEMYASGRAPKRIVEEKGLIQISDTAELEAMIDEVFKANAKEYDDYKAGKTKLFGFFVGQCMKATKGKGNPGLINQLLKKKLND